jgi:hypothetical protein
VSERSAIDALLDRAERAGADGRGEDAARLYDEAIARCRAADDLAGWTRAALGAAAVYVFGSEPGHLPAQLYNVLVRTTDPADRARIAAALARCWVYAGRARRAAPYAAEALGHADLVGDAELLADCLDAMLSTRWGPDDFDARISLTARIDDAAAHVLDPNARLQAHLWGLQIACEALDMPAAHRHLRALGRLGEESARAAFFAASRQLMFDLLQGRTETAPRLIAEADHASAHAGLPDAWMVIEAMKGYAAVQTGDEHECATVAAAAESFALGEGATAVCAEAAYLWVGAGELDHARRLVNTFHDPVLADLPRDVNWLLTLQCVLEAALAVDDRPVIASAAGLLAPYASRPVFNAGAVAFHGLTSDTLARAAAIAGDQDLADRRRDEALEIYGRLGATWWRDRLLAWLPPADGEAPVAPSLHRFHPVADGLWLVGADLHPVPVRALRGFVYLRELLRRPGRPIAVLDLVEGGGVDQPGLGDVLDATALASYRERLRSIEEDLAEAEDWSDLGRQDVLQAERDALVAELTAATGLGGRTRVQGSSHERARVAVTKAIHTAIDRIASVDATLAEHLAATVHTGAQCRYEPSAGAQLRWRLDP